MSDLKVPKRRVPVEVVQPGGAVHRVTLFLAEAAPGHTGPERVGDLLNGGERFIPAFDEESKVMTFLNRDTVALVRVGAEAETGSSDDFTIPTEHEVEITLADGSQLRGLVSFVLPPERARLVDFLNDAAPFFRLVEPSGTALVGRRHVARVALASR